MNRLPIYIDMDEVICDFLGKLINTYNEQFNKNLKLKDIKQWSLKEYIGKKGLELFNQPGFFADLKPIDGSIKAINLLLKEGREVFIMSSPINEHCAFDKYCWVKKYLPKFPIGNLILVGNKGELLSKINDGILFDDCPMYIEKFPGISILMKMPYNLNCDADFKVSNWNEFYQVVRLQKVVSVNQ